MWMGLTIPNDIREAVLALLTLSVHSIRKACGDNICFPASL